MSRSGKSQKFVNVRREQVVLDEFGNPMRPPPEYNPLRPEASGLVLKSGAELEQIVDASSGKIINPHVPLFIAKAPWYSNLKHVVGERKDKQDNLDNWYERGAAAEPSSKTATKYRKGACENCGAMTHKTKDCLERPRKVGAKYTGKNIASDERIQDIKLGFEAKRDRWNGYDPTEQLQSVKEWELVEQKRQHIRIQKGLSKEGDDEKAENEDSDSEIDEAKKEGDGVEQKIDEKNRMTVRNLRIREDTAKYLRNLDLGSAYYDPKTRSMRENPYAGKDPKELLYAGDNFERYSGQVKHVTRLKDFAWEKNITDAPGDTKIMSLQANPTQAEQLYKSFQDSGGKAPVSKERLDLLDKYGGKEYLMDEAAQKELIMGGQSEEYVEYNAQGDIVKGTEKVVAKSRWPEDVLLLNHTEVWGSFYEDGEWGFACCQSTLKGSYCGGKQAIEAKFATQRKLAAQLKKLDSGSDGDSKLMPPPATKSLSQIHSESLGRKGPATLELERIEKEKAAEEDILQHEVFEIKEREKVEKKAREREQLEKAKQIKLKKKGEEKALKFGFEKSLADSSAIHQYNLATGGKWGAAKTTTILPPPKSGETSKLNQAAVLDLLEKPLDDMTPYLPADAKVASALKAIEQAKVQAQGAQGFAYLRKKRKWEMSEEELEAYRTLQHHGDDPMAKFIKQ